MNTQINKNKQTNNKTIIRDRLCGCRHVLRIVIQQASSQIDKKLSVVRVPIECNIRNSNKRKQSYRSVSLFIFRILEKRKEISETKMLFLKANPISQMFASKKKK